MILTDERYLKLLDVKYSGEVVKQKGRKGFVYDEITHRWIESGILPRYLLPESPSFENYEIISKKEAQDIIKSKETI